jgi:hypothetical protein
LVFFRYEYFLCYIIYAYPIQRKLNLESRREVWIAISRYGIGPGCIYCQCIAVGQAIQLTVSIASELGITISSYDIGSTCAQNDPHKDSRQTRIQEKLKVDSPDSILAFPYRSCK